MHREGLFRGVYGSRPTRGGAGRFWSVYNIGMGLHWGYRARPVQECLGEAYMVGQTNSGAPRDGLALGLSGHACSGVPRKRPTAGGETNSEVPREGFALGLWGHACSGVPMKGLQRGGQTNSGVPIGMGLYWGYRAMTVQGCLHCNKI